MEMMTNHHEHTDGHAHCIHDHCGCCIVVNGRKGKLSRTKVLGLQKTKCAIVEWEDTGKRDVMSFTDLKNATLESSGECLLTDEEKCHCK